MTFCRTPISCLRQSKNCLPLMNIAPSELISTGKSAYFPSVHEYHLLGSTGLSCELAMCLIYKPLIASSLVPISSHILPNVDSFTFGNGSSNLVCGNLQDSVFNRVRVVVCSEKPIDVGAHGTNHFVSPVATAGEIVEPFLIVAFNQAFQHFGTI